MAIHPLDDRIVVEPMEAEEKTAGGIVLPDTAKEKPQKGKVVAVGPGKLLDDGKRAAPSVKKGDTILYAKYGGSEVKVGDKELLIMRESDVLAKVE
jgi:chaperonin GroES